MISNIVDLNRWRISFTQFRAQHTLETWRCGYKHNFMAVKNFPFDSVFTKNEHENVFRFFFFFFWGIYHTIFGNYLNITSLNSGLFTNFGSILDPFAGCKTSSLIGLIGSQPKHVANISANNNVVPSFWKLDFFFFLFSHEIAENGIELNMNFTHFTVSKYIE